FRTVNFLYVKKWLARSKSTLFAYQSSFPSPLIALRSASTPDGIWIFETWRFSRRCSSEEVPGISRMLGERCSNQASATCIGVASNEAAARLSADDCNGVKPPSGKNGT